MARLFSSGFELNSTTAGVEWTSAFDDTPTLSTTTVRSGAYSMQISSLQSEVAKGLTYTFSAAAANGPYFFRSYLRVATRPSADNTIVAIDASDDGLQVHVKLASDGSLKLFDEDGQIGSASSVLSLDTSYIVELQFDHTGAAGTHVVRARLSGVEFAGASNRSVSTGVNRFCIGGNGSFEAQTTGDWFFDDIAINDSTGSFQNSYPGEGEIIHLRPNAAGDAMGWTGAGYTVIDEVTPNDATDLLATRFADQIFDVNVDATPAALEASDEINVVQVGVRYNGAGASANAPFVLRIKDDAAGTVEESSAITPANTTWVTNANAAPRNYPLSLYDLPGASTTAWTKSKLDTTQIGARVTTFSTNNAQISTMWLLVEHKPAAAGSASSSISSSPSSSASSSPSSSPSSSVSSSPSSSVSSSPSSSISSSPSPSSSVSSSPSSSPSSSISSSPSSSISSSVSSSPSSSISSSPSPSSSVSSSISHSVSSSPSPSSSISSSVSSSPSPSVSSSPSPSSSISSSVSSSPSSSPSPSSSVSSSPSPSSSVSSSISSSPSSSISSSVSSSISSSPSPSSSISPSPSSSVSSSVSQSPSASPSPDDVYVPPQAESPCDRKIVFVVESRDGEFRYATEDWDFSEITREINGSMMVRVKTDQLTTDLARAITDIGNRLTIRISTANTGPSGVTYFSGYIPDQDLKLGSGEESVEIVAFGFASRLFDIVFRSGTTVVIDHTSAGIVASDLVEDVIDSAVATDTELPITYTVASIEDSADTIKDKFVLQKCGDVLNRAVQLAYDATKVWYWTVLGDNVFRFQSKVIEGGTADHSFTYNKDAFLFPRLTRTLQQAVNEVFVVYNGGANIKRVADADSIALYGPISLVVNETNVPDSTTATELGNAVLASRTPPIRSITVTISCDYYTESINPGDTCRIDNLPPDIQNILTRCMFVTKTIYKGDTVDLELSVNTPYISSQVESIRRRFEKESTEGIAATAYA